MLATRTSRGLAAVSIALAATLVAAVLAPHGSAGGASRTVRLRTAVLACGDTVAVSTKLAADLTGCSGAGLTVAGSHITLDLNGHLVTGQDVGTGIRLIGPGDVVLNGTVRGFLNGVMVDTPAVGGRVQGLRANANNGFGVLVDADRALVTASFAGGNAFSGITTAGDHDLVTNDWLRGNQTGIDVVGPSATVSGNKALSNTAYGIDLENEQPGTVVTSNVANANGNHGIFDESLSGSTLSKNVANFNTGAGIVGSYTSIDGGGNTAKGNAKPHQCEDVVCS